MKYLLIYALSFCIVLIGCKKSGTSSDNGSSDNNIQKQIVNTKWYYDSTVFWHKGDGFTDILDFNDYNQKTYLYFDESSTMTEYYWTGTTYKTTAYPYIWNGDRLVCDYDFINDFPSVQIKNNQLIFADLSTAPRQTDTTGQTELLWWYYHK